MQFELFDNHLISLSPTALPESDSSAISPMAKSEPSPASGPTPATAVPSNKVPLYSKVLESGTSPGHTPGHEPIPAPFRGQPAPASTPSQRGPHFSLQSPTNCSADDSGRGAASDREGTDCGGGGPFSGPSGSGGRRMGSGASSGASGTSRYSHRALNSGPGPSGGHAAAKSGPGANFYYNSGPAKV